MKRLLIMLLAAVFVLPMAAQKTGGYKSVSAGDFYAMVVKNDGSLWAWGCNGNGEFGDGTTNSRHFPVKIAMGVKEVSAGSCCTVFLTKSGELKITGRFFEE